MPPVDHFNFRLERTIHVLWNGVPSTGPLTLGPIEWLPTRKRWACHWSIHAIHSEQAKMYGDDPIQALDQTIKFITDFIRRSIEDGIQMWWQYEGDICGFVGIAET
jgi:hypothetical protein